MYKRQVKSQDAVIFFNFREDRARQLTRAFIEPNFKEFPRKKIFPLFFVTMTLYDLELKPQPEVAFPLPQFPTNVLAEVISKNNLSQFHTAETEKYAHVTYFFNGGREKPFPKEDRKIIPSPKVKSYAEKPEMSAEKVKDAVISAIDKGYHFIVVNFANCDMVGHTGNFTAAVKAVETVDKMLGEVAKKALEKNYTCLITADHGNVEQMLNPQTLEPDTEHTTNPVPVILAEPVRTCTSLKSGILADVAPTILDIMKLPKPKEMTGRSLVNSLK